MLNCLAPPSRGKLTNALANAFAGAPPPQHAKQDMQTEQLRRVFERAQDVYSVALRTRYEWKSEVGLGDLL